MNGPRKMLLDAFAMIAPTSLAAILIAVGLGVAMTVPTPTYACHDSRVHPCVKEGCYSTGCKDTNTGQKKRERYTGPATSKCYGARNRCLGDNPSASTRGLCLDLYLTCLRRNK